MNGARLAVGRPRQLADYMFRWRLRLDRRDIPGLMPRRSTTVTQEEAALLAGVTHAYYGGLERGRIDRAYSDRMLDGVSAALRLSAEERRVLYLLAVNREPEPVYSPPGVSPAALAWVLGQRWPAFISTRTIDVLACNPAAWAWLPGLAEQPNLAALWFTPQSRAQCVDWETEVAPRAISRLRAQLAKLPDDGRLQQVVYEVLGSCPLAQDLWEKSADVRWYDDGARIALIVPGAPGPTVAEFVSATGQRSPNLTFTTMIPVDGHIPDSHEPAARTGGSSPTANTAAATSAQPSTS